MNPSDEPKLLLGAAAITAYVNKLLAPRKVSKATVYRWIENKRLPVGRLGAQVLGSARVIREHLEGLAGGGSGTGDERGPGFPGSQPPF